MLWNRIGCDAMPTLAVILLHLGHRFFIFCFTDFQNKIHSDHFPIELKSKETRLNEGNTKSCFLQF